MTYKMLHVPLMEEQSAPESCTPSRTQNRVKIRFAHLDRPEGQKFESISENDPIDAWNTGGYSNQQDIKGLKRLIRSCKNKKKNTINFISRAAVTSRSWNAERERLLNLRKQMHLPSPVFESSGQLIQKEDRIVAYLRKRKEQKRDSNNTTRDSSRGLPEHQKLLSRIYSYDPQVARERICHSQSREGKNESCSPSIKLKHSMPVYRGEGMRTQGNQNLFQDLQYFKKTEWKQKEQEKMRMRKIKSTGWTVPRKQKLKIV